MHQRTAAIDYFAKLKYPPGQSDESKTRRQTNLNRSLGLAASPFSGSLLSRETHLCPFPTTDGLRILECHAQLLGMSPSL